LLKKGLIMLTIHAITVFFVSQLPETKGSHFGRAHDEEEEDDLVLTEEPANGTSVVDTAVIPNPDHQIT
jgi:hypothetical protein